MASRSYQTRRTTTTTNRPSRRPLYAPPPPPGGHSRQHSVLGYWVPLVVTGTIAIGGLAAWIWSERNDHDESGYPDDKPQRPPPGQYPGQGITQNPGLSTGQGSSAPYQGPLSSQNAGPPAMPPPVGGEAASYYGSTSRQTGETVVGEEETSWYGQMRGAIRRTPSPEVFFSQASKHVSAGMAAAGAAAGAALGRIMEDEHSEQYDERRERREDREGFSDHERWSEEADESDKRRIDTVGVESERRAEAARAGRGGKSRAKRAVAVVVSADTNMDGKMDEDDLGYMTEHASILSHLSQHHDPEVTDTFILIYTPGLQNLPPITYQPNGVGSTLGSSYSQISTPAMTPSSEHANPHDDLPEFKSPSSTFTALYQQALALVSSPSQILPFTTVDGYVHILRHLAPSTVYVSDMLAGNDGQIATQLKGWVGHTIVALGDNGTGGLADTETEDDETVTDGHRREKWYERSSLVGLGKDVEVVDATRVGDDWAKRFGGRL